MEQVTKPNTTKVEAFVSRLNDWSETRIHIEYLLAIINLQYVHAVKMDQLHQELLAEHKRLVKLLKSIGHRTDTAEATDLNLKTEKER